MQLVKGGSRDHRADFRKRPVRPSTVSGRCKAEPNFSPALLYPARKSTIVDDLAADRGNTAGTGQRFRPDEHASACCSRRTPLSVCDPLWRIQLKEEKDKRGDQQFFPKGLTMKFDH